MPLVSHTDLPAFKRLAQEGQTVLDPDRASHQDIRELHIGLLNMMPDGALTATERQFFRLVGASNLVAQYHMHVFSLDTIPRSDKAKAYINHYYETFEDIKAAGLDALIISGANPAEPELTDEPFWQELTEVIDWANEHVTSVMCSCLATHAVVEHLYQTKRQGLPEKCWGVYKHFVTDTTHPLVSNLNTRFETPHSRYNDMARVDLEKHGVHVLAESPQAGVHIAVSSDLFRWVFLQGHPEYDRVSLLKEYKREIVRWFAGQRSDYPVLPENIIEPHAVAILEDYANQVSRAKLAESDLPDFPESLVLPDIHITWRDTAKALFSNWLGRVYQVTHRERNKPFMDGIDPNDPLGLRKEK